MIYDIGKLPTHKLVHIIIIIIIVIIIIIIQQAEKKAERNLPAFQAKIRMIIVTPL
jgi:hypothetical protein